MLGVRLFAFAVAVLLLATACSTGPTRGQSEDQARTQLESAPGVSNAIVNVIKEGYGLAAYRGRIVQITVDRKKTGVQPSELVKFALGVAWSVDTRRPDSLFSLIVLSPDGTGESGVSWRQAARDAGFDATDDFADFALTITPRSATDVLGAWPGKVPTWPGTPPIT
jgi:hypothetical protein